MTRKPTVHASYNEEALTVREMGGYGFESPGIRIKVTFQLHDHEHALRMLDKAVADIRAQIEETK